MKNRYTLLVVASLVLTFTAIASGQQILNPTTQMGVLPARGTFAIRNVKVVTVSGADIENGTVVIRDGKIEAVGTSVNVPAGAQTIEGRGLSVYPGMIDLGTSMGLVEIPQGANGTVDTSEVGDFNPNAKAIIAVSPYSAHIGVTRVEGITTTLSSPTGGLISGQSALINLLGTSPKEMGVIPAAALVINYPRIGGGGGGGGFGGFQFQIGNLAEVLQANQRRVDEIRKFLQEGEAYGRAQDAYAKDNSLPRPNRDVVLEALVPYVRGQLPVIFRAEREQEIRGAIRFAEEMKLKPIILGGEDAVKVASLLKEKNVPVILTNLFQLPGREDDAYDIQYETPYKLQQAGVRYCISTGDPGAEVRNLGLYAGMASAFGLTKAEALKAVTLNAAQIINAGDRLGSIEVGKMANLVVTDGDLLEIRTKIKYLFIDGRPVPLTSRHTDLNDAFKNRK